MDCKFADGNDVAGSDGCKEMFQDVVRKNTIVRTTKIKAVEWRVCQYDLAEKRRKKRDREYKETDAMR